MSEETRAKSGPAVAGQPATAEEQAQHASDTLKDQIAALRTRVKNAQRTLSEHVGRQNGKPSKD